MVWYGFAVWERGCSGRMGIGVESYGRVSWLGDRLAVDKMI